MGIHLGLWGWRRGEEKEREGAEEEQAGKGEE
jgi:hypothetical protein